MKTIAAVLLFFGAGLTAPAQDSFTQARKGEQVPAFTFESQPGVSRKISDYKGKVVLITFFATWCGPCRMELPHIDRELYQSYRKRNDFVVLTFGREHDWETVNKFKASNKLEMPLYPDPKREIFTKFAAQNIPRNFLIDQSGRIVYSSVGFNEAEFAVLKNTIAGLLK